tara:strand:- start:1468 stop:1773 length:306 start_codon:yes stop_codon:yes gene_type:complete
MSYFNSNTNKSIEDYVQYLSENSPQQITHGGGTNTVIPLNASVATDSDKTVAFQTAITNGEPVNEADGDFRVLSPNLTLWDSDSSELVIVDYTTVTDSQSV